MDFFETMKSGALCGKGSGGDTPSPSGDAYFSKFSFMDWWGSEICYMDNTDGIYSLPNADTTFPRTDGYGIIVLVSPAKTITGLENLDGKYSVQFTPAADFHVDVEFTGTVTAGDGKVYLFYYEDGEYQIMTEGVDFYISLTGGGGGEPEPGNLITSAVEQGYYATQTMEAGDSAEYCRVHGTIACETQDGFALVWADLNGKSIRAYANLYLEDDTYVTTVSANFAPLTINVTGSASPAKKMTIMFASTVSGRAISPEDIGCPTLVKV